MSDEMTFTLHNPLTEEEWDMIADADLDHTSEITFHTKHGKEVEFVKRKKGRWINHRNDNGHNIADCDKCGEAMQWFDDDIKPNYCPNCGAYMESKE